MLKFRNRIKKGGLLIINGSVVDAECDKDKGALRIPFTDIAVSIGNIKVANMVALGSYLNSRKIVKSCTVEQVFEELSPKEGDIILRKTKYSAFWGTNLDTILKALDAKYLLFVGVATNICVEASIRDAFYHEYFPILISDAAMHSGPSSNKEATIFLIKSE